MHDGTWVTGGVLGDYRIVVDFPRIQFQEQSLYTYSTYLQQFF